ncbi:MAG: hypothetical protein ACK5GI_05245, partial [Ignavibacteria bacterium]
MKHYSMIAVLAVFGLSAVVVSTQPFVDQTYKIKSFKDVQYAMVTGFDGRTDTLRMNIVVPTNDN